MKKIHIKTTNQSGGITANNVINNGEITIKSKNTKPSFLSSIISFFKKLIGLGED